MSNANAIVNEGSSLDPDLRKNSTFMLCPTFSNFIEVYNWQKSEKKLYGPTVSDKTKIWLWKHS